MHEGYQHIRGDVVSRKGRTRTEGDVKVMAFVCVYKSPEVDMVECQHLKILE